jgi:hypothetical protein
MGFKRKVSRIGVSRKGHLQRGSMSAPCQIIDVSESGVRIESRLFVKTGDTLQLAVEVDHCKTLACMLEVVHVRSPRFGAKITSISSDDQARLAHVFDDHLQTSFSRR